MSTATISPFRHSDPEQSEGEEPQYFASKPLPSTASVDKFEPQSEAFTNATRIHQSLTAAAEKRLLTWLAERAPAWLTSDQLTILGLLAQIGAGIGFATAHRVRPALLLVIACITLNWLGDSLDGTLARVRQQQRPRYGFYVDHVVDIFGTTALFIGLACSGFMHPMIAASTLIGFLLLAAESYLATHTLGRFHMSQGFFGPTELRLLLIAGCVALWRSPYCNIAGHRFLLFDIGGIIATIGMLAMVFVIAARHTAELYTQEPLP